MRTDIFERNGIKKGHTLVEVMVVIGIFLFLFATLARIMLNSERTWQTGKNKLVEADQARRATGRLVAMLREANPEWIVANVTYPVTISESNTRIDFYEPIFNASGNVTSLKKVTFKLNPSDSSQLLMKEGTAAEMVVASAIQNISIDCGCASCTAVDSTCPNVDVNVTTMKNTEFNWTTQVTLRNTNMAVAADVVVEEPAAGEF